MRVVTTDASAATIEFAYDELVLLYLGLAEATEALSPAEFRARVGRPESDADLLLAALKPVVVEMESAPGRP